MAHFAEIDINNKVLRVLVVDNEQEHRGQEFLSNDLGLGGTWIQTSYNNNFRTKFAGIGDFYNQSLDRFEPTSPYPSWIWDEESYSWISPVEYPQDDKKYVWDEASYNWIVLNG